MQSKDSDPILQLMEAFEQQWRSEGSPQIEDYLHRIDEEHRAELLEELVAVEMQLRSDAGQPVTVSEYELRFNEHVKRIWRSFKLFNESKHSVQIGISTQGQDRSETISTAQPALPARYEAISQIGRGGMGAVWRVCDRSLGRTLAVKVLLDAAAASAESRARFQQEALITGGLQHPGIPPVVESGELGNGLPFFSMKLVEGRTLATILNERTGHPLDASVFLGIFEQICQAVGFAHSRGVIHRDLKPENIMVGAFGEVQVMDWGMAKQTLAENPFGQSARSPKPLGFTNAQQTDASTNHVSNTLVLNSPDQPTDRNRESDQSEPRDAANNREDSTPRELSSATSSPVFTQAGIVMGTPGYMSPEQALGKTDVLDERSDVFGLGAILCEIITGKPPYTAHDVSQIMELSRQAALDDCFDRLSKSTADPSLIELTKKCLSVRREQRPAHAGVLAESMRELIDSLQRRLKEAEIERAEAQARTAEKQKRLLAEQNGARRLRRVAGVTVIVASAAIIASVLAISNANKAEQGAEKVREANGRLDQARQDEQLAKSEAVRERNHSQKREALLTFRKGVDLCQQGKPSHGLHWIRASLDVYPGNDDDSSQFDHVVRCNLASWSNRVHRLDRIIEHPRRLQSAVFSVDGSLVFTACQDDHLRVFERSSGRNIGSLRLGARHRRANGDFPISLAMSANGSQLAVGTKLGNIELWDPRNRSLVRTWKGHDSSTDKDDWNRVSTVSFSPDGKFLATASVSNIVRVWDLNSGLEVSTQLADLNNLSKSVRTSVAFTSDGKWLLTAKNEVANSTIQGWSTETWKPTRGRVENEFPTYTFDIAPNGANIVTGGSDGVARILNWPSGNVVLKLRHPSGIFATKFSPDGRTVAVGCFDGSVTMWNVATGNRLGSVLQHDSMVTSISLSGDGRWILTSSADATARIWRMSWSNSSALEPVHVGTVGWKVRQTGNSVGLAAVSADGSVLATSTAGSERTAVARVWDAMSGRPRGVYRHRFNTIGALAISPDCSLIGTGAFDHGVVNGASNIGSFQRDRDKIRSLPHTNYVSSVSFTARSDIMAAGDYHGFVRFWDAHNGQVALPPIKLDDIVVSLAISPDNTILAVGTSGSRMPQPQLHLWDLKQRKRLCPPLQHEGAIRRIAFDPATRRLLAVCDQPQLWDLSNKKTVGGPLPHSGGVTCESFHPNGSVVAMGSRGGFVRLWDTSNANQLGLLTHSAPVASLCFDEAGDRLLVGCEDGTAHLWDWKSGLPLSAPESFGIALVAVGFSPQVTPSASAECIAVGADESIKRWKPASAVDGTTDRLRLELELITGKTFDGTDQAVQLTKKQWHKNRELLGNESDGLVLARPLALKDWHRCQSINAIQEQNWPGARWHLQRLLTHNRDDGWLHARIAMTYTEQRSFERADMYYNKAELLLEEQENSLATWFDSRRVDCQVKQKADAESWYLQRLKKLKPGVLK